jgi:hypothetical protein
MKKKFVKFFIFGFASICGISILSTNAKAITYQDLYTNYRVKNCEYAQYDLNTYYKNPIDDSIILGEKVASSEYSLEKKELLISEYGPYGVKKKYNNTDFSKYAYRYTFLTTINAPYQDCALGQFLIDEEAAARGVYPSITRSLEEINSTTFEEKVVETVSTELSASIKGEYSGLSAEIKSKISSSVSTALTTSSTICHKDRIDINIPITKTGYYRLQQRALYEICALSIYEIMYYPKVIDNSNFYTKNITYDYENGTQMYKYLGTETLIVFLKDYSMSVNRYVYDKNLKKYIYDGMKDEAADIYL